MIRFVVEDDVVNVPDWVVDLESFRRWADDDAFPEKARISYLRDAVWVDLSMEQVYTHADVKAEINGVLRALVNSGRMGRCYPDGVYLSNVGANISNQPDAMFASAESLRAGRLKSVEGRAEGCVEMEGTPDMVLEVVSRSSVSKDYDVLREAYFAAGIREYWLIDARKTPAVFDILRIGRSGYVAVRKRGWIRSEVFDASFRLTQGAGVDGHPAFLLEVQPAKPS